MWFDRSLRSCAVLLVSAAFGFVSLARAADLLVSGYNPNSNASGFVDEYTPSGTFVRHLVEEGSGGLTYPYNLRFGPDGNLYVADGAFGVRKYDGTTGAFIGNAYAYGSPNGGSSDILFDSAGTMYATSGNSLGTASIVKVDPATGTVLRSYPYSTTPGQRDGPSGIAFLPNGHIAISDATETDITELDPVTGATSTYTSGLGISRGVTALSDGRLLVSQVNNASLDVIPAGGGSPVFFASVGSRPYFSTVLNGNIFVASNTGVVTELSDTGQPLGSFPINTGGDIVPIGIASTVPEPSGIGAAALACGIGMRRRRVAVGVRPAPCPG